MDIINAAVRPPLRSIELLQCEIITARRLPDIKIKCEFTRKNPRKIVVIYKSILIKKRKIE